MLRHVLAALVVMTTLAGCGHPRTGVAVFFPAGQLPKLPEAGSQVTMQYLGNGGWVIRYENDVIATAPFFTNPRFPSIYLPGKADPDVIDVELAKVDLSGVEMMLVGHGHYDHAMDLPYILTKTKATLYGGRTVYHLFVENLPKLDGKARVVDVSGQDADGKKKGSWVPSDAARVRFMPLKSEHAPHVLRSLKVVSRRSLTENLTAYPLTPAGWPEGDTLAYLIDFVRAGKVVFRIYYQDAAAPPGLGVVPDLADKDKAQVDVAILCVAGFDQVTDNPGTILSAMKPGYVVGGHWENFFMPIIGEKPQVATGTSLEKFVHEAQKATGKPVFVPAPYETLSFPIRPR